MRITAITQTRDGKHHQHAGFSDVTSARGLARARADFEHLASQLGQEFGLCQSTNAFGLTWKNNHRLVSCELDETAAPKRGLRTLRHGTVVLR